ncbi:ATP-binding protein [Alteribacillus sp. JSM 102045]|uniref:ATP-binding protein n=1 Tax=Alteribacillus sp. JSM 102045 TaxID=1562101 RepID=UPI0035C0C7B8
MKDFSKYIKESHLNCREYFNLNPEDTPYLYSVLTKEQLQSKQQIYAKVLNVAKHFMKRLINNVDGIPVLVVTTDDEGYLLDIYGDETIKGMIDKLGITVGASFTEEDAGTNAVSLALKHREPVAVIGEEHFHYYLSETACYSAPFFYTEDRELLGTVSIMSTTEHATSFHLGMLISAVDTIEREIELQQKNHKLNLLNQVIINSTPLGVIMTDSYGRYLEFNAGAEKITGVSKEKILKVKVRQVIGIDEYIKYVLESGNKVEDVEISFPANDSKRQKVCLLDVFPLYDKEQMIGSFAQFRDLTSYHHLQKQVIQSEKLSAIGKLGTGLAHEIRNPITSIIGLSQLLKENNNQNKYLEVITAELERMKSLVNQFVSLGKPIELNRELCDICELVKNTVDLMTSDARLHNCDIHFKATTSSCSIKIDEAQMKQVLINFIKNAFEAMPFGGRIDIEMSSQPEQNKVHLAIKDEGKGMTQEEVDYLGTPFFTTKQSGLGMGLPVCFDIVKSHQGKIEIDSKKGSGTTVHVILPINHLKEIDLYEKSI